MLSDLNFQYEINKAVQNHAAKSNGKTFYAWYVLCKRNRGRSKLNIIILYRFSVDSKLNGLKRHDPNVAHVPGASHGDDLFYLFKLVQNNFY